MKIIDLCHHFTGENLHSHGWLNTFCPVVYECKKTACVEADSVKENRAHTSCCSPALMIKLSGMQSLANYMEK